MYLKKKIVLNFFVSAFLIAILAVFEYANFVAIRREIRFLELTDTVRSKSLQLRRHEKNFFLYAPESVVEESRAIHHYLNELERSFSEVRPGTKDAVTGSLLSSIVDYRRRFDAIEIRVTDLGAELRATRAADRVFPFLAAAIYERPRLAADFLQTEYGMPSGHPVVSGLVDLDAKIASLRKSGEDIITNAKELDRVARDEVESVIGMAQAAILIVFPVFLATGVALLFLTTRNVVSRLQLLMDVMEQSRQGTLAHVGAPRAKWGKDEVGLLIRKFDELEDLLERRQADIEEKSRELLQSRKLAAIGTLASGVAHELNNPLSNISLSIQVLIREMGDSAPAALREAAGDIMSQTARVKKIVRDLLEFSRGREPQLREMDITELIRRIMDQFRTVGGNVSYELESPEDHTIIVADQDQLERVFINLFTNAVEAALARSEVRVSVSSSEDRVHVRVADTGRGIPKQAVQKVFDPFFSTKEKGTGLGLAIVFNIIQKHGGEISVESEEGKGTVFMITLPRSRVGS